MVLGTVPVTGEAGGGLPELGVAGLGDEQPQPRIDLLGEGHRDRPGAGVPLELGEQAAVDPDRTLLACYACPSPAVARSVAVTPLSGTVTGRDRGL